MNIHTAIIFTIVTAGVWCAQESDKSPAGSTIRRALSKMRQSSRVQSSSGPVPVSVSSVTAINNDNGIVQRYDSTWKEADDQAMIQFAVGAESFDFNWQRPMRHISLRSVKLGVPAVWYSSNSSTITFTFYVEGNELRANSVYSDFIHSSGKPARYRFLLRAKDILEIKCNHRSVGVYTKSA